jgi:hypothetical protein
MPPQPTTGRPSSTVVQHRQVPNTRIQILHGVGHTPMFEDPAITGALLHTFTIETTTG